MKKRKKEKQKAAPEVNWQPLSRLPLIAELIDEGVIDAEKQEALLKEGKTKPYVLDDAIVGRIKRLYKERLEIIDIYGEQIERWKKEVVDMNEHFELVRLTGQCKRLRELAVSVLALAEEIGEQTIDKILAMDDAELGLRVLLGELGLPFDEEPKAKSRKKAANKGKSAEFELPELTVNRRFIEDFVDSEAPAFALGLVEEKGKTYGFLALRPDEEIPLEIMAAGFTFGHGLLGTKDFEVIRFGFDFYGFESYNVLINPNNAIARTVLATIMERGDYFVFAMNPNGEAISFRAEIEEGTFFGLKENLKRLQKSTTTEAQYRRALLSFKKGANADGTLLNWVCRDDMGYLDLTKDRYDMSPAPV